MFDYPVGELVEANAWQVRVAPGWAGIGLRAFRHSYLPACIHHTIQLVPCMVVLK